MKYKINHKQYYFFFLFLMIFSFSNAQIDQDKLDNFINKKIEFNKSLTSGHFVLLYVGNENEARNLYNDFKQLYSDINIKLSYTSPDWKVQTPVVKTKLEAERILLKIKTEFPNAKVL